MLPLGSFSPLEGDGSGCSAVWEAGRADAFRANGWTVRRGWRIAWSALVKCPMNAINLYEAKTNLSSLVDRAAAGEEIVIAKGGRPLARLVPLNRRTAPRPLGLLAGQVRVGADFDDPLPDDVLRAFEGLSP